MPLLTRLLVLRYNTGPFSSTKLGRSALVLYDIVRAAKTKDMLGGVPVL